MADDAVPVVITKDPGASRYVTDVDGHRAELSYLRRGDRVVLVHTGVPPAIEGRGIAGALAAFALDDARAEGLLVVPRCPYVRAFVARHPEYDDIIAPAESRE